MYLLEIESTGTVTDKNILVLSIIMMQLSFQCATNLE